MRIGFDAKRAFLNYSGLGNYSRTIIWHLAHFYPDDQHFLYTPRTNNAWDNFPPEGANLRVPKNGLFKIFSALWRSLFLATELKNDQLDIYHGLSNELPVKIKKTGIKSVVTIHDLIFLRYPHLYKAIDRYIYRQKFLYSAQNADMIIAVSEQTKQDIINFLDIDEDKIRVVYQSCAEVFLRKASTVEKEKVKEKYKLPASYILYVGTIEKRKNLLKLVSALKEGNIDYPLVAVGKQKAYANEVHAYIAANSLHNIHFLENIQFEDLPVIYQMSDLFVYPSSFEGFGIPVLEALNSGVPVIAGSGSCLEETGGPNSVYIDPENTEELAVAIQEILEDSQRRETMIEKGYHFAKHFSKENTTKALHDIYESICQL